MHHVFTEFSHVAKVKPAVQRNSLDQLLRRVIGCGKQCMPTLKALLARMNDA